MQVLAALGDAPTAVIAILAIALGVFLAARGPREKRAADDGDTGSAEASGRPLFKVPVATAPEPEPDVEPGFVGPQGEVVGHGRIRLGATGPLGGGEPAAADAAAPVEPAPAPQPARQPEPEPPPPAPEPPAPAPPAPAAPAAEPARLEASPAASEQALFTSPPTLPDPPAAAPDDAGAQPAAAPEPAPTGDADADAAREPAWRIAARAANSAVHFRQGTIKLGGKPANEPKDPD
jgi:hypothetical protein